MTSIPYRMNGAPSFHMHDKTSGRCLRMFNGSMQFKNSVRCKYVRGPIHCSSCVGLRPTLLYYAIPIVHKYIRPNKLNCLILLIIGLYIVLLYYIKFKCTIYLKVNFFIEGVTLIFFIWCISRQIISDLIYKIIIIKIALYY